MSLKQKLNNLIRNRFPNSVSINEIEDFCKMEHKKLSNAERRLRQSESPDILRIVNKKGAIVGYVWNGKEHTPEEYSQALWQPMESVIKQKQGNLFKQ